MKKNSFISIIVILLIMLISLAALFYPFLNFTSKVGDDLKNTFTLTSNGQLAGLNLQAVKDTFYGDEMQLYISSYSPLNPKATFVGRSKNSGTSDIYIYNLKRTNFNSFEYVSIDQFAVKNKTYSEALEIAKKYDLTKTNPDNLTVFPAPSREDVEKQKESEKKQQALENNADYKIATDICLQKNMKSEFKSTAELNRCYDDAEKLVK